MGAVHLRVGGGFLPAVALALAASCAGAPGTGAPGTADGRVTGLPELGRGPSILFTHQGTEVCAFVVGDPAAPRRILFVHGWAGSGAEFLRLSDRIVALRPDIACYCLDLPGSGSSGKPAGAPYDIPYFRSVIHAAVDAVSARGLPPGSGPADVTLAGHSLGGHICADYAARDCHGIDRLVLIAPAGWPGEVGSLPAWASKNGPVLDSLCGLLTEETYIAGNRILNVHDPDDFDEAAGRYTARSLVTPEGLAALKAVTMNALERDCVDEVLGSMAVPVMLAWGRNDAVLRFEYAARFMERLPAGTVFVPFERCGHMAHYERTAELAAIIAEFIGTQRPGRSPGLSTGGDPLAAGAPS